MAYKAPDGPPPGYPQQAHFDAGPVGSPPPQQYYGSPAPYQQGPYGGPPQGQYGAPYQQQPMYYQQQGPPAGYYQQDRGPGAGTGICAGIMGALACCCCLDILF